MSDKRYTIPIIGYGVNDTHSTMRVYHATAILEEKHAMNTDTRYHCIQAVLSAVAALHVGIDPADRSRTRAALRRTAESDLVATLRTLADPTGEGLSADGALDQAIGTVANAIRALSVDGGVGDADTNAERAAIRCAAKRALYVAFRELDIEHAPISEEEESWTQ